MLTNEVLQTDFISNPIVKDLLLAPEETYQYLIKQWNNPWRFYHTVENHLKPMINEIIESPFSEETKNILKVTTWFHDVIYNPKKNNNEDASIQVFCSLLKEGHSESCKKNVIRLIEATKTLESSPNSIEEIFLKLDFYSLRQPKTITEIINTEQCLLKEFQHVDYASYKSYRIKLLKKFSSLSFVSEEIINAIIEYLENHRPNIAIYPGSFNPFHVGHLSILHEAEKIFDKVIIAVGHNPKKEKPTENQLAQLEKCLPFHQKEIFDGFLHDYASEKEENVNVTIIRGFRSGYDIDAELINLAFMRDMSTNFKVVFIAPQKVYDHISSSAIRQIEKFGTSEHKQYLPDVYYPCFNAPVALTG